MKQPEDSLMLWIRTGIVIGVSVAIPALAIFGPSLSEFRNGLRFVESRKNESAPLNAPPEYRAEDDSEYVPASDLSTANLLAANSPAENLPVVNKEEKTPHRLVGRRSAGSDAVSGIETAEFNGAKTSGAFSRRERELRERLGATASRLENWGARGNLYRFSCFVAASEQTKSVQKHFQSIDPDPLRAIEAVIADVERWKNRRIASEPGITPFGQENWPPVP